MLTFILLTMFFILNLAVGYFAVTMQYWLLFVVCTVVAISVGGEMYEIAKKIDNL